MDQLLSHLQEQQVWGVAYMDLEQYAGILIDGGPSFSLICDEGVVWGCAGVCQLDPHRANAWALIREGIGGNFFRFHKEVYSFLCNTEYNRVEMAVDTEFQESERWARMLGFELEGYMRQYFPDGRDAYLYARVK